MKALVGILGMIAVGVASGADAAAAEAAEAAENPKGDYYRLCSDVDLAGGTWKLMTLKETPKHKEASRYRHSPYQYIAFYPDNLYSFIAARREITKPVELQKALEWPQKQARILKYTLDDQGVLNLYIGKKVDYSYRCLAVTKDKAQYKKRDLILTGYTRKGRTKLYKLYRRWF